MSWVSEALDNFITGLQDSLSIADAVRHLSGCKIAKWVSWSLLVGSVHHSFPYPEYGCIQLYCIHDVRLEGRIFNCGITAH